MPNVTIQDVRIETVTKGRNSYQAATVVHTNDRGEQKEKKVMSFANPAVFAVVKDAKSGEQYEVSYTPGDQFYAWASINRIGGDAKPSGTASGNAKVPTTSSTYETKDERAENRVRIVRQSCLGYAIALMTPGAGGKQLNLDEVKIQAQELVDWVYRDGLEEDDIPF